MRILFMGTPDFALPTLRALCESEHTVVGVVTKIDTPKGRGHHMMPTPIKVFALEQNIPVYQPNTLKGEEFAAVLEELDPDGEMVDITNHGVQMDYGYVYPGSHAMSSDNGTGLAHDVARTARGMVTGVGDMFRDAGNAVRNVTGGINDTRQATAGQTNANQRMSNNARNTMLNANAE
jgi:hypothetical protein